MGSNFSAMGAEPPPHRHVRVGALTALLTALAAIGPVSISIYVPALPAITHQFAVPDGVAKLTMSVFLLFYATAQLLYGPVADAYGRRPALFGGAVICVVGCLICALAPSIEWLIIGRAVQGIGACCGMVITRAVVRDLFEPRESLKMMATVGAAIGLAPAIGPGLGGLIYAHFGWRWIFVFVLFALLIPVGIAARTLNETLHQPNPRALHPRHMLATYWMLLSDAVFVRYALIGAFAFGGMFVYITGSPYLLIERLGVSPPLFGYFAVILVAGFFTGNMLGRQLGARLGPARLVLCGGMFGTLGGALLLASIALRPFHLYEILGAMFVYQIGTGLVMATALAAAIARHPRTAGAASALSGFIQMAGAAVGSVLVAAVNNPSNIPMAALVFGLALSNLSTAWFQFRSKEQI